MNKITQHVPSFADQRIAFRAIAEFETVEQLLTVGFVRRWNRPGAVFCKTTSLEDPEHWYLMVDYDVPGGQWWVIGMIDDGESLELPVWSLKTRENLHGRST